MKNPIQLLWNNFSCVASIAILLLLLTPSFAEDSGNLSALNSITSSDLRRHTGTLADDALEGRGAGTVGGLAAARYITSQLEKDDISPANADGKYFQNFSAGYRNILAEIPGSDPELKNERVFIGAHFDHVGYGTSRTSKGPLGYIHNGADDNASGVATVLELAQAVKKHSKPFKRTVVIGFWDGEEQGLVGSKYWLQNPTFPLDSVKLYINIDMVGRLRNGRIELGGTRTGFGLRQLASTKRLVQPLHLDFDWQLRSNSDHWPFFKKQIPVLYLFTGLHEDYHRPSDDIEKLDIDGMQEISRYLFELVERAANRDKLSDYRIKAQSESRFLQKIREKPLASKPPRLEVRYQEVFEESNAVKTKTDEEKNSPDETEVSGIRITAVSPYGPGAKSGLAIGDVITAVNNIPVKKPGDFLRLLLSAPQKTTLSVLPVAKKVDLQTDDLKKEDSEKSEETDTDADSNSPKMVEVTLNGQPIRIGMSWRVDDANPSAVYLTRVDTGSPADIAGLRPLDRIYSVNGKTFQGMKAFGELIHKTLESDTTKLDLVVETVGRIHDLTVDIQKP